VLEGLEISEFRLPPRCRSVFPTSGICEVSEFETVPWPGKL
jgi:hypothetical protein